MKINCVNPDHKDANPSMEVYPERAYCFSCGFSCKTEDLDLPPDALRNQKRHTEDIVSTIRYIRTLPLQARRGLEFHTNGRGFYIVYPNDEYYKLRLFQGDSRYLSPTGTSAPPYLIHKSYQKLIIVEGEINLLSLQKAYPEHKATLCSPGSAGNLSKFLNLYLRYKDIWAIVDYDRAGVLAGVMLKQNLKQHGKRVHLVALDQDLNDTLQSSGVDGVRQQIKAENLVM